MIPQSLSQIPGWKELSKDATINGVPYRIPSLSSMGGPSGRGSHKLALIQKCARAYLQRYGDAPMPDAQAAEKPDALKGSWFHALACSKVLGESDEKAFERGLAEGLPKSYLPLPKAAIDANWEALNSEIERFQPQWQIVETELAATISELWPENFIVPPDLPNEVVTSRLDRALFKVKGGKLFIHIVDYKTKKAKALRALSQRDHDNPQAALNLAIIRARFPGAVVFFSHCQVSLIPPFNFALPPLEPAQGPSKGLGVECEQAIKREQEILAGRVLPSFEGFWRGTCHGRYGDWPCEWSEACLKSKRLLTPKR